MKEITDVINLYFQSWNESSNSQNSEGIRKWMSKDFVGIWGHSKLTEIEPYYYDYDLDLVLKNEGTSVHKSFEVSSIVKRDHEYIVSGRETNQVNGKYFYAQCMFIWRKEKEEWKLLREYIELER